MKKTNLKVLLVALSSVFALAACNSGSSSNPSPAPSPTVSPTTSPSPGPTQSPAPTPAPSELGAYVNQSTAAGASTVATMDFVFSVAPSTGNWVDYVSGANMQATGVNQAQAIAAVNGLLYVDGYGNVFASADGTQFSRIATASTAGFGPVFSPETRAVNQPAAIVSGGANTVVYQTSFYTNGNGRYAINGIDAVSSTGTVTRLGASNFTMANGTPLSNTMWTTDFWIHNIVYMNGSYYLFQPSTTSGAANEAFVSTDGVNWTGVAAGTFTANVNVDSLVQVGDTFYGIKNLLVAPGSSGTLVSGSALNALTTTTTIRGVNGANPVIPQALYTNGTNLYVWGQESDPVNGLLPKSLYYYGNGVAKAATAQGTFATQPDLMFVGSTVYDTQATSFIDSTSTPVNRPKASGAVSIISQVGTTLAYSATSGVTGVVAPEGNNLLVANANNEPASVAVVDSITSTSTSYNLLPVATKGVALAGTPSSYVMIGANGAAVMATGGKFVTLNTISTSASIDGLQSNGSGYMASDTDNNLYISSSAAADLTWTKVSAATISAVVGAGFDLTSIQAQNGTYFLTFSNGDYDKYYQTNNPTSMSSWSQITGLPYGLQVGFNYWDNTWYVLSGLAADNTTVYVYDTTTGYATPYANVLPQAYSGSGNIAYNGTAYYLAQGKNNTAAASKTLWSSSSLTGGAAAWTSQTATFKSMSGSTLTGETFNANPTLLWTGAAFLVNGSTNSLYNSQAGATWAAQYYTINNTKVAIDGIPSLFGSLQ